MLQNKHPCPSPTVLKLHKANHFFMCIDRCAAFALCINVTVCVCSFPLKLSVYFYVFTCSWYVCVNIVDKTVQRCIYSWSPWSSKTLPVFTDPQLNLFRMFVLLFAFSLFFLSFFLSFFLEIYHFNF